MVGEFALCEFNKQKAIKYNHEHGDFDFLLTQANDGSEDIHFYCSVPISEEAKQIISFAAMKHLKSTAKALRYNIKGEEPNFIDAIHILETAWHYLVKQGGHSSAP